jgi:hypothetical protein
MIILNIRISHVFNRSFSSDVTAAILVYQNNEMAAILVYGTGISSFLFKYFVNLVPRLFPLVEVRPHSRTQSPSYARSTERDEGLWPNPYQTGI